MNRSRFASFLDWSVRIGRLFGIPISLHITLLFFLYPVLVGSNLGVAYVLEYALLVVVSILIHELGHALTAKRYGLTGLSIMLHGFGGFAASRGRRTPKIDLAVSLAGPAVTFILGFVCLGVGQLGLHSVTSSDDASTQFSLIYFVGRLNLLMGVLNLIPSLPFDGGQALVAILSFRMPDFKAMRAVAHLGLVICAPLAIYGLFTPARLLGLFGIMGLASSLVTLLNSGGVKFGEVFADRRLRRETRAMEQRQNQKNVEYLKEVQARQKEREEQERLRKLLGG